MTMLHFICYLDYTMFNYKRMDYQPKHEPCLYLDYTMFNYKHQWK